MDHQPVNWIVDTSIVGKCIVAPTTNDTMDSGLLVGNQALN